MALRSANINIMVRAAEKAGMLLLRDFNEIEKLQISKKSPEAFMQKAREKAASILAEELQKTRSEFTILSLPQPHTILNDHEELFIFNPLEGAENFQSGIPFWCITIAYIKKGKTKAGIIFDPVTNELYWTQFGVGAFLNNTRLYMPNRKVLKQAHLVMKMPPFPELHQNAYFKQLQYLSQKCAGFRSFGCPSLELSYVAAGKFDGYIGASIDVCSYLVGELMATESGGHTKTFWPNPETSETGLLASSEGFINGLHKVILTSYASLKND